MNYKKEKVDQLLENKKLLLGNHEPRSSLNNEIKRKHPYFSKDISYSNVSYMQTPSSGLSILGDNNLLALEEGNQFGTYEDYCDHKYQKRKERKSSR